MFPEDRSTQTDHATSVNNVTTRNTPARKRLFRKEISDNSQNLFVEFGQRTKIELFNREGCSSYWLVAIREELVLYLQKEIAIGKIQ